MKNKEATDFLTWLKQRMYIKHQDRHPLIHRSIDSIISHLKSSSKILKDSDIEEICKSVYPLFEIEKDQNSMFDVGYTKEEKDNIRKNTRRIIKAFLCQ